MTNCLRTLELVLSQQGANADLMTKGGMAGASTALHWAASRGLIEAVSVLLRFGADPTLTNTDGHSALRLALDRGFGDVADALDPEGTSLDFERGTAWIHQTDRGRQSCLNLAERSQRRAFGQLVRKAPHLAALENKPRTKRDEARASGGSEAETGGR